MLTFFQLLRRLCNRLNIYTPVLNQNIFHQWVQAWAKTRDNTLVKSVLISVKNATVAQHQMHFCNTKIHFPIPDRFPLRLFLLKSGKNKNLFQASACNHGCHVEFYISCSLSQLHPPPTRPPRRHLQPVRLSVAEDKQMPANLVLALTSLAATIKHGGSWKTSRGLFLPQITGLSPHLIVHASQCRSVFCAQVLEMPGFARDDGGAKLNVAELCWQMRGSHCSLRRPPARQPPSHKRKWQCEINALTDVYFKCWN